MEVRPLVDLHDNSHQHENLINFMHFNLYKLSSDRNKI